MTQIHLMHLFIWERQHINRLRNAILHQRTGKGGNVTRRWLARVPLQQYNTAMRQWDRTPQTQATSGNKSSNNNNNNTEALSQLCLAVSGCHLVTVEPSHHIAPKKPKSLRMKSRQKKRWALLVNGLGENLRRLKIFFLPVTTPSPLLFIEGDKSLRSKYFITKEWPCDLPYLTKDAYNSFKNRFWTQSRPLSRSSRST